MMIGRCSSRCLRRRMRQASKPFMPGMSTSSSRRSGTNPSLIIRIACSAELAVLTSNSCCDRTDSGIVRMTGSSSTIRIRGFGLSMVRLSGGFKFGQQQFSRLANEFICSQHIGQLLPNLVFLCASSCLFGCLAQLGEFLQTECCAGALQVMHDTRDALKVKVVAGNRGQRLDMGRAFAQIGSDDVRNDAVRFLAKAGAQIAEVEGGQVRRRRCCVGLFG